MGPELQKENGVLRGVATAAVRNLCATGRLSSHMSTCMVFLRTVN